MSLYQHQVEGIKFLVARSAALLCDEQGTGKTRQAILAAWELFGQRRIDRVLVLCPAAVRYAWGEELGKLLTENLRVTLVSYKVDTQAMTVPIRAQLGMPIAIVSYGLLRQDRHVRALSRWCAGGDTLLICDESTFIKNRTAKQSRGALSVRQACVRCWLLTGTPVANDPLDLWAQGCAMAGGVTGPLASFKNFYHFRATYAVMGGYKLKQAVNWKDLEKLQARFAPYALRRLKTDCLDLPPKSYVVREVALGEKTWKVYEQLRKEALLVLGKQDDAFPEPNAAVRILRLGQLTSGHVGTIPQTQNIEHLESMTNTMQDISSEKLDWLVEEILEGEFAAQHALIVWCRWRRERERLAMLLEKKLEFVILEIYGGQTGKKRDEALSIFGTTSARCILLAQPHAGGYGLTLTAAHTAIYLSNDYSYVTRVQSEDRCHRLGQVNPVTYVDVLATGPQHERTIDHVILGALKAKEDLARWTCAAWRRALGG